MTERDLPEVEPIVNKSLQSLNAALKKRKMEEDKVKAEVVEPKPPAA